MTSNLKKLTILSLAFVWCFLCGVCCLEAAEHFQNSPDDQAIEQLLSVPVEKTITADHGQPAASFIVSIPNLSLVSFLISSAFITHLAFLPGESPPRKFSKLYHLYSNYRI